jgi:hypothetical protein
VSEAPDTSKDPAEDAVKDIPDPSALPSAPNNCQEEIAEVSANAVTDLYAPAVDVIIADPELPTTFLPTSDALNALEAELVNLNISSGSVKIISLVPSEFHVMPLGSFPALDGFNV